MPHAMQFIEYNCGHSNPVTSGGAKVDRPCTACMADSGVRSPGVQSFIRFRVMFDIPKRTSDNVHTGESHRD